MYIHDVTASDCRREARRHFRNVPRYLKAARLAQRMNGPEEMVQRYVRCARFSARAGRQFLRQAEAQ